MSIRVLPEEKEKMYLLYQHFRVYKTVAEIMDRSPDTVSKYVHEVAKRKALEKRNSKQLDDTTRAIIKAVKEELGIDLSGKV